MGSWKLFVICFSNIKTLNVLGLAPQVYGIFENGLAYQYYPGVTLNVHTVLNINIWPLVARQMAKMHKVKLAEDVSMNNIIKPHKLLTKWLTATANRVQKVPSTSAKFWKIVYNYFSTSRWLHRNPYKKIQFIHVSIYINMFF